LAFRPFPHPEEEIMQPRIRYRDVAPPAYRAMATLERHVATESGLERPLIELVKMRASQINGCAFCLDMHSKDARAAGETEQRLYVLSAWREAPFYSPRERAALAWTEAVTLLPQGGPDDELFAEVRAHFDEREIVELTMAVITINGWNRLAVSFRSEVGNYQPAHEAHEER
jgi:AhpD family alkylhydroperoxidase